MSQPARAERGQPGIGQVFRQYDREPLGIRAFVRARHLLAPLEAIAARVPTVGDALDVGCGHGLFSLLLALRDPDRQVLGVDPSPAKIAVAERAGQHLPNLEFRLGSVEAAKGRTFRAITVLDVLYLLPLEDKLRLLRGCRELLQPDGVLLLKANDTHPNWKYAVTRLQEWAMTTAGLTLGHGGLYFQSCAANRMLLREAGFEADVIHLGHWSPYPHVLFVARPAGNGERGRGEGVGERGRGGGGGADAGTRGRGEGPPVPLGEGGGEGDKDTWTGGYPRSDGGR